MINREHKDRLFKAIFGNPDHRDWTLSLYNALNGTTHTNAEDIEFNTIEDVIYMGMRNDLSYLFLKCVNMYEQQSTYNPNMPARFLMYYAKILGQYFASSKGIYGSTLQKFPAPNCVCFYNGLADQPDLEILELEDGFLVPLPEHKRVRFPVEVYNVNAGHNSELLNTCKPLAEYAWFVEAIRQNAGGKSVTEQAVNDALTAMPESFQIRDFLLKNKAEVIEVCLTEYNEAQTLAQTREEGREEGREEDRHEIWMNSIRNFLEDNQGVPKAWLMKSLKIPEGLFDRIAEFLTLHPDLDDQAASALFQW